MKSSTGDLLICILFIFTLAGSFLYCFKTFIVPEGLREAWFIFDFIVVFCGLPFLILSSIKGICIARQNIVSEREGK